MADIPVNDNVPQTIVDVVVDGQTDFDFDFRADFITDLAGFYVSPAGLVTVLTAGVDFTATGLKVATGGTISLVSLITDEGGKVTVYRSIDISRPNDYSRDLFAAEINSEMDRIFMILQEQARDLGRSLKVQIGGETLTLSPDLVDGDTLMKLGAFIVKGPNAAQILAAEGFAEQAQQALTDVQFEKAQFDLDAAEAIDEVEAIRDQALAAVPNVFPISLAALKALNTASVTHAFYDKSQWVFTAGNFSTQIAADTTGAIYAKADAIAATAGAWVRQHDGLNLPTRWTGGNLQAAIDLAWTLGIPTVTPTGTHTLTVATGSLKLRPGVVVHNFARTAILTQANNAGITQMMDFAAYGAAGAVVDGLIIDGNRANNAAVIGNSNSLALIYDTNDVTIRNCLLRNSTGNGILIRNALRYKIHDNEITNVLINGINALRSLYDIEVSGEIMRNRVSEHGQHGIVVAYSDHVIVEGNTVTSSMLRSGLNVLTSGANVSSLSGAFFAASQIGRFIVLGGGFEFLITGYNSPTSIVVSPAPGENASLPAAIGQGDNYSIQGCSNVRVRRNKSFGGVTLCYSVFADSTRGCFNVAFEDNISINAGSAAYSVQITAGGLSVLETAFRGNTAIDPGKSNTAGAAATLVGIYVSGGALTDGVLIDGNVIRAFSGFMTHGIRYEAGVANKLTPATNLIKGFTTAAAVGA